MKLDTLLVIWKTIVMAVLPRTTISSLLLRLATMQPTTHYMYILWLLGLGSFPSSHGLIVKLLLSCANLSRISKLIEKCNRSFVVICCDTRQ